MIYCCSYEDFPKRYKKYISCINKVEVKSYIAYKE